MNTMSSHYFSVRIFIIFFVVGYLTVFENLFLAKAYSINYENLQRPEVWISQGKIQGMNMATRLGREIFGFVGVPYGQPPVGNLRFKAPLPAGPWNDTLDGSIIPDPCPQLDKTVTLGNEDCLHVNVYTPQLPVTENSTLLPVMIYVVGGRFMAGTNDLTQYGPEFILDKDVVLVVPNYRLGILGFLSTGDEISPGNYGLKDLVLALEWVRDNIRYFGGDPNRVTIAGGSSGAISVHLLTLSDLTKGLFHGYITQSGLALSSHAYLPRPTYAKLATQLGKYFGCPTNTSAVLVDCLRGVNVAELIDTESLTRVWKVFPYIEWGPTIEPEMKGAFLTDIPGNLFAAGKVRDLPWLESVNRDEGIAFGGRKYQFFYDKPDVYEEFFSNLDTLLPVVLRHDSSVDNATMFFNFLKSYYLNNLTADTNLLLTNFTQLADDYIFLYPTYRAARQQLIHAREPHYLCSFNYVGVISYSYRFTHGSTENWGVSHGDELLYLFPSNISTYAPPGRELNENHWRMVDTMVHIWTSFIINGTPTILDPNDAVVWEPYSLRDNYLRIGNGPNISFEVGYNLLQDRLKFWEELYVPTY